MLINMADFVKQQLMDRIQGSLISLKTAKIISKTNDLDIYKTYHYLKVAQVNLKVSADLCKDIKDCSIAVTLSNAANRIFELSNSLAESLLVVKNLTLVWSKFKEEMLTTIIELVTKAYVDLTHSDFMFK